MSSDIDQPIAALATPYLTSALAVIRITGKGCISLLSKLCKKSEQLLLARANYTRLYELTDPRDASILDTAMITIYYAPKSYTGQDSAEISMHGSLPGIQRMLDALYFVGFEHAEPGEFTKRAFLNGKLDLTQAEAINDLVEAQNYSNHMEAAQKLGGSVASYIDSIKQDLLSLVAACHVSLDYPEDEIQEDVEIKKDAVHSAARKLDAVLSGYELAQLKKAAIPVVLAGRTNAGKSSLFNALLKEDRAIISQEHGTTRDFLECAVSLKDLSIAFYDTAGIRDRAEGDIETEGMQRARNLMRQANIVLYVLDLHEGWQKEDTQLLQSIMDAAEPATSAAHIKPEATLTQWRKKILIVCNKTDLCPELRQETATSCVPAHILAKSQIHKQPVFLSAKNYLSLDALLSTLYTLIISQVNVPEGNVPLLTSLRQKQLLEECRNSLEQVLIALEQGIALDMISLDLDAALSALGKITGEVPTEDILEKIFSSFCVGK